MNAIIVATFHSATDAEPLRHLLAQSGIPAQVQANPALERMWMVDRQHAGVRVRIPARDHPKALRIMHASDASDEVLRDAIRCPECGSLRVEYPQFTRKFFLPNLIGLLSALHLVEKDYYCEDCHSTRPGPEARVPTKRAHMAPYYFIEGLPAPSKHARKHANRHY